MSANSNQVVQTTPIGPITIPQGLCNNTPFGVTAGPVQFWAVNGMGVFPIQQGSRIDFQSPQAPATSAAQQPGSGAAGLSAN